MPIETLKTLMADKSFLQVVWLVVFAFFIAVTRVLYTNTVWALPIIRSVMLSMSSGMFVGLLCYYKELNFLIIVFCTSLASALWEKIWDWIMKLWKEFPQIFKDILTSYLKKWWKGN